MPLLLHAYSVQSVLTLSDAFKMHMHLIFGALTKFKKSTYKIFNLNKAIAF